MADIVLYTTMMCPYCARAKKLLDGKGLAYTEVDVTMDPGKRAEMTSRAGGKRTVPQIFIGEQHVGGSDDLYALERSGRLDALLTPAEAR